MQIEEAKLREARQRMKKAAFKRAEREVGTNSFEDVYDTNQSAGGMM